MILAAFPEGKVPRTEDDRAFAGSLAQQCAQALERARLYEAQRLQAERLAHLQSATAALSGATSPAEVAEMAHAALGRLGATTVELHAFAAPDRLAVVARQGEPLRGRGEGGRCFPGGRRGGAHGEGALARFAGGFLAERFPELSHEPGKAMWAVVPLLAGGTTTGALAARLSRERLEPDERVFLRMLAMPCAQALERVRWAKAAALNQRAADWLSALLEGALTAVPVGLALLDETMRVVRTSERLALLAGVSQEAQRGRTLPEVFPGLPREALVEAFQRAMGSGERLDRVVSGETLAAAGETRRFVLRFYPVRVSGKIVGVGVLVHEAEQQR